MTETSPELIRLNKLLAENTGVSRREADDAIARGDVRVNGIPAILGARVSRGVDHVELKGKPVDTNIRDFTYLMLNKPTGYVCSRKRQGDTPTIYELLPKEYSQLKPVGRLDKDSSGILLLTDDGDFALRMTHPSFQKVKVYEVSLDKPLEPLHQQMISDYGVSLDDGTSKFTVEKDEHSGYIVTMREGRNRQIRRTFAALGYTVTMLHRITFGPYQLEALAAGKYIEDHSR